MSDELNDWDVNNGKWHRAYSTLKLGSRSGAAGVQVFLTCDVKQLPEEQKTKMTHLLYGVTDKLSDALQDIGYLADPERPKRLADHVNHLKLAFAEARMSPIYIEEVPNEYCPRPCCLPWHVVTTPLGHFKVGWRKRVLVLDWSRLRPAVQAAIIVPAEPKHGGSVSIFAGESTTQSQGDIHCWGYEKLDEYLKRIAAAVTPEMWR